MAKHRAPYTGDGRTRGPKIGKAEFDVKRPDGSSILGAAFAYWTNRPKKRITGKVTKKSK